MIGIRVTFKYDEVAGTAEDGRKGQIPMRDDGWNADYPDAEKCSCYCMDLRRQANHSRFNLPGSTNFRWARTLPARRRARLFDKMTDWSWPTRGACYNDIEDSLANAWVRNYVPHPMRNEGGCHRRG